MLQVKTFSWDQTRVSAVGLSDPHTLLRPVASEV
jgi:hypothetical protein